VIDDGNMIIIESIVEDPKKEYLELDQSYSSLRSSSVNIKLD
jgi:hypothetical protein